MAKAFGEATGFMDGCVSVRDTPGEAK